MHKMGWAACMAVIAALAACNQKPAAPTAESLLFPALGATPYAANYSLSAGGDELRTMRMLRSGANQRIETTGMGEGKTAVILIDGVTGKMTQFQIGEGAPKAALLIDRDKLGPFADAMDIEADAKANPPKHLGSDTVAGEKCETWEFVEPVEPGETAPAEPSDARQACVTRDGILLRVQQPGSAQPELIATKVDKGPQDPSLFAVPDGYQIVDMSECTNALGAMLAAAQSGQKPDKAMMAKCQNMAKMMSGK